MKEGRRAMTAGEFDRAVPIFTKVLSHSDGPAAKQAQELLGLARERKGQLAHAKAEYETYLERYPDGEGANRVRQAARGTSDRSRRAARPQTIRSARVETPRLHSDWQHLRGIPAAEPVSRATKRYCSPIPRCSPTSTSRLDFGATAIHFAPEYTGGYSYDFLEGGLR